ncbi:hypothetical protein BDR22DRAFT_848322 [Usnea florida]
MANLARCLCFFFFFSFYFFSLSRFITHLDQRNPPPPPPNKKIFYSDFETERHKHSINQSIEQTSCLIPPRVPHPLRPCHRCRNRNRVGSEWVSGGWRMLGSVGKGMDFLWIVVQRREGRER